MTIETGRRQQIRRRLAAVFLAFREPFSGEDVELRLPGTEEGDP